MVASVSPDDEEGEGESESERSWKPGSRTPMAIEKDFTVTSLTALGPALGSSNALYVCTYSQ